MTKLLNIAPQVENIRQFGLFDDFFEYTTGDIWTTTADTGTAAVDADGIGGALLLTTDSTDNDEVLIESRECFKVANSKPIMVVARMKINCTTANQADFIFGLMDGVAGDSIATAGGPAAGKHLALMYSLDGTPSLTCYSTSTAAGTYNQTTSDATITDNEWRSYMMLIEPVSSTDKRITFYYDVENGTDSNYPSEPNTTSQRAGQNWVQLKDTNGVLIQQTWSLADTSAGTGELALMAGVRAGSAEAQELAIDYLGAWQLR